MWVTARMSELQYGKIPELEKQLEAATQLEGKTMRLLRNKGPMPKLLKCWRVGRGFRFLA